MRTRVEKERHTVLVRRTPSATLHLIVGGTERGMVLFTCEQAPLLTRLIDLYTRKMKQYHAAEMAKVKPLLDSKLDSNQGEEVGAHAV